MDVILKENERIDDLERNGYRIIQNSRRFCFGMDAVLLSGFAAEGEAGKTGIRIADLGTGTGIIPLLLHGKLKPAVTAGTSESTASASEGIDLTAGSARLESETFARTTGSVRSSSETFARTMSSIEISGWDHFPIIGLEIQEDMADMAERSVRLNHLEQEIGIVLGDICQASDLLGKGRFEVVTSNPPYMKQGGGLSNPDSSKAISRHEILCTFEDVAAQAAALLKPGGRFYLVHRPERLAELIETLRRNRLEPKRLRMVHSFADSEATMVLIESAKGGGTFMKVEKPLIIYQEQDVYTDEILQIYYY